LTGDLNSFIENTNTEQAKYRRVIEESLVLEDNSEDNSNKIDEKKNTYLV
jgi:hypothetical protein